MFDANESSVAQAARRGAERSGAERSGGACVPHACSAYLTVVVGRAWSRVISPVATARPRVEAWRKKALVGVASRARLELARRISASCFLAPDQSYTDSGRR